MFAIVLLCALLAYAIYDYYKLWSDPQGHWKRYTGRVAWFRAKTRGTILSLFDVGGYKERQRYIHSSRIFGLVFIIWGLFILMVTIVSMK